jgi:hypothetical protein
MSGAEMSGAGSQQGTTEVLRGLWDGEGESRAEIEASFGEGKTCRNMKHVNFDSMAEPGSDLGAAWREKLRREGKLGSSSLGELILGEQRDEQRPDFAPASRA